MGEDSRVAIELMRLLVKGVTELVKGVSLVTREGIKQIGEGSRELLKQNRENKIIKAGNKQGEVSYEKLTKNHKQVTYEHIKPENLKDFKTFAKQYNLQYSLNKEADGNIKVNYGVDHADRMKAVGDSMVRSESFKKNQPLPVKDQLQNMSTEKLNMTIDKLTEKLNKLDEKLEKLEQRNTDLEGKLSAVTKEKEALKRENNDLRNEAVGRRMEVGKKYEPLDKLVSNAESKSKAQAPKVKAPEIKEPTR